MIKIVQQVSTRFAGNTTAQGAFGAFAIKVGSSSLSIVMFTVVARVMGPVEFGHFAIWFNAVSFLAVIALCGQETLIVRSWSEYIQDCRFDLARGALSFGIAVSVVAALVAAACVAIGNSMEGWANSPSLLVAACLFLIVQTVAWLAFIGQPSLRLGTGALVQRTG